MKLYKRLKDEIIKNYEVGKKLPSIRKVAELNNISKTTVESAYSQLYAEGYIESRPKSGYFVSDFKIAIKSSHTQSKSEQNKENIKYDFFPAKLDSSDFPLKIWKRLQNRATSSEIDFGSYGDGQGELELREEIARYLNEFRGANCRASEVVITHGFSDSLSIIAKLLKSSIKIFAMEHPGYHVAKRVFSEYGYDIKNIKVLSDGIDMDELEKSNASLLYITPSHQYPTGAIMPIAKRLRVIEYMQNKKGYIIEDDYDSELKYNTRPIPALQGLGEDVTIYLGTFAKVLSPAIRVGYMVLPKRLMREFNKSYEFYFSSVNTITQKSLALFMKEGYFDRHLRKIRKINKTKHNLMIELLNRYLKDSFEIVASGGGLAILIMPTKAFDWELFKKECKKNSIKIYLAKERSGGEFEAIRMGFGGFKTDELKEAIEAFSRAWHKSLI